MKISWILILAFFATPLGASANTNASDPLHESVDACGVLAASVRLGQLPAMGQKYPNLPSGLVCKCKQAMAAQGISSDSLYKLIPGAQNVSCDAQAAQKVRLAMNCANGYVVFVLATGEGQFVYDSHAKAAAAIGSVNESYVSPGGNTADYGIRCH